MADPIFHYPCSINSPAFAYGPNGVERLKDFEFADIADDTEFFPFSVVQRGVERRTKIGRGTKVDHAALVGHDSQIGEGVTIAAGALIAGFVVVEDNAYLGMGCRIRQRLRIGRNALVGMGAVVIRDVPPNVIVVGSPARFLRYRFPNEPETKHMTWNGQAWA